LRDLHRGSSNLHQGKSFSTRPEYRIMFSTSLKQFEIVSIGATSAIIAWRNERQQEASQNPRVKMAAGPLRFRLVTQRCWPTSKFVFVPPTSARRFRSFGHGLAVAAGSRASDNDGDSKCAHNFDGAIGSFKRA
jgi:hypothetical protein